MATNDNDLSLLKNGLYRPHLLQLASSLNELRTTDVLTDITLTSGNRSFRAHKAVLVACSSYFAAMFTSGFQESTSSEVSIEECSSDAMEQLLNFVYTGVLDLNEECIVQTLRMASYLHIETAIGACMQFLKDKLESENADVTWGNGLVFQVYLVALHHEMTELKQLCWNLIINDFVVLSKTEGFRSYVTAELLEDLLGRHDLIKPKQEYIRTMAMLDVLNWPALLKAHFPDRFCSSMYKEEQVLETVIAWLEHDWPSRKNHALLLLKKVRLGVIPVDKIQKVCETSHLKEMPECKELLHCFLRPESAAIGLANGVSYMFCSRGTITALVATGGKKIGTDGPFARYFYYNNPELEDVTWIPLLKLPKPTDLGVSDIQDHTMVTLDGKLYLAGGGKRHVWSPSPTRYSLFGPGRTMLDSFYRYNPSQNSWQELPRMLCGRAGFAMVMLDGLIYAVGGWDAGSNLRVNTDIYDTVRHMWNEGDEKYVRSCHPAAVVFKNKILMYGHGINDGHISDSVHDFEGDEFEPFAMEMALEDQRNVRTSMHTLQMYDPESKKWCSLMTNRHYVHTVQGDNEQYSSLVVRNDKCYRVIYDKMRERHCWISKPRVHELVLDLESSAPSAKLGQEEVQPWLPEYHAPGAFCIEREIYVNVNGCIVNTGQKMPVEKPTDGVSFSRWLSVDSPEMTNSAVALFSFDHYNLTSFI